MDIWTDKYSPKTLDDIVGNSTKIDTINEWLQNFKNNNTKKVLLISGPPGIGKTTLAHLILKKYNYVPIEFNTSTFRGSKNIREIFDNVLGFRSVIDIFKNGNAPTGIIMDEIDTLCSGGDKGGMTEFLSILKERKTKNGHNINNPIICIFNEFNDKKLTELKNFSLEIKMNKPTNRDLEKILDKIAENEKLKIDEYAKILIIKHSMGDVRRLINILYDLYIYYKNVPINEEKIESLFKTFMKKNIDPQIFDSVFNIFNKNLPDDELASYYQSDILLFPMMIHENYINSISNTNVDNDKKFEKILEISDTLIENDIYQTYIYENQAWELSQDFAMIFCKKINEISTLSRPFTQKDRIIYSSLLNKLSFFYSNKKLIKSLDTKLGINISFTEIYYLSEIIHHYLFHKKIKVQEIIKILKHYNLNIEHIDLLLRINRFVNQKDKKKFTSKMKKEILDQW